MSHARSSVIEIERRHEAAAPIVRDFLPPRTLG
jgi:hypothetical protein